MPYGIGLNPIQCHHAKNDTGYPADQKEPECRDTDYAHHERRDRQPLARFVRRELIDLILHARSKRLADLKVSGIYANYSCSSFARISFITSEAPAPIVFNRASR